MPPACRFTREQIVAAALAITRERGFDAVTARAIADTLHSSSKVIFSAFSGMDDLLAATIDAADAQYRAYSADFVRNSADPPYKAVGTAYIRFARNEPNLFHLLYMRDRRREDHSGDAENIAVLVDFLMAKLSLTREDATLLNDRLFRIGEKCSSWLICAFALLIWGAAQVGNMPVITTYRIGIYLTAFLLGYAVFAHEAVMARVERMRWGTLAAAVIGAVAYGVWTNGQNFTDAAYLQSLWANVYLWAVVLAVLGNARHYLHQERAVSRFFTQRSYALYVVHYPVLLLTALLLTERTTLPVALTYLLTLLIGFGATLGLSEIIRRIPGIRWLVLGIRKEKKA